MSYYLYFSKTYWNCLFFLRGHFFGFAQSVWIFGQAFSRNQQKGKFSGFRLQYLFCFREANATYMVWCIPNIHTAYLLGKFVAKIKICQYKLKSEICRIQSWWSIFLFQTGNTLFWANLVQKIKIVSFAKIWYLG